MSLLDFFSKDHPSRDEISKSKFDEIFNRNNRSKINIVIKELNKHRFKSGIIYNYKKYSTMITCEYLFYGGLRINIPQKSGSNFYKTLSHIIDPPGDFAGIFATLNPPNSSRKLTKITYADFKEDKNYYLVVDVASKKFRTERKIFKDISKSQPIIDFIIKKINEFDSLDKSLQNYS
jgi:hypothetical protein